MKIKTYFQRFYFLFASYFAQNTIEVMSFNIRLGSVDDGETIGTSEKIK